LGVEDDLVAFGGGGVVDEAGRDAEAEHFFEAKGLGAELDVVVDPAAGAAFFVFDGAGLGDTGGIDGIAAEATGIGLDRLDLEGKALGEGVDVCGA